MEGKPFVLVSVDTGPSREALRVSRSRHPLPGAACWDGPNGPVSTAWGVERYPTLFLVDARGVVRARWVGKPPEGELEHKAELLVKEAKGS
jgi:hypothetical protein